MTVVSRFKIFFIDEIRIFDMDMVCVIIIDSGSGRKRLCNMKPLFFGELLEITAPRSDSAYENVLEHVFSSFL